VAAAASPYDSRSDVLRGVEWWEARGYRVKLGDGVWDRDDYVTGDARRRGEDLNALFADPEVDVVQALQGIRLCAAIPYLDFELIAENPKPLVGYSDLTALHVAIPQRAGVATIYGNGLMGVGSVETTAFTKERLLDVLRTGGAALGHTKHLAALPLGITCTLDADAKTLTVDEPALR
jgi:muramoyltetrapeptide carboxypeptidase